MAVNRTILYVDNKLAKNIDWLSSLGMDLNEMEKNLLSAFNIDVRRSPVENRNVTLSYKGK